MIILFLVFMSPRHPISTLFPYTTLFRSELTKMQLDNQKEIAEMQNETQKEIAGIQSATSRQQSLLDRKSGSAGMPRPISYAVFCLKKKKINQRTQSYANQPSPSCHSRKP